jgi:hypothetical protein
MDETLTKSRSLLRGSYLTPPLNCRREIVPAKELLGWYATLLTLVTRLWSKDPATSSFEDANGREVISLLLDKVIELNIDVEKLPLGAILGVNFTVSSRVFCLANVFDSMWLKIYEKIFLSQTL